MAGEVEIVFSAIGQVMPFLHMGIPDLQVNNLRRPLFRSWRKKTKVEKSETVHAKA